MCCVAASLPCCNSYQLPVSIGYRTPLGSARLGGVLDILLGNGEFISVCRVLRERAVLDLFTPQYLGGAAVGAGEARSSLCMSFMERFFPVMGLSFAKFTSCSGSEEPREVGGGLVGISSNRE